MSKHTPGPWHIGTAYTDDEGYVELPIQTNVNGKSATPAAVCLQFPHVSGMQEANALLIAAAPDLLEFAASVVAVLEHAQRDGLHLDFDKQAFLKEARLVIARATPPQSPSASGNVGEEK